MLKQKARAIAIGVLLAELALTAVALPVAYLVRHGILAPLLPTLFPIAPAFSRYMVLLLLILPIFGPLLYAAGFHRSHRTLPLGEEIWSVAKVAFGGTAILTLFVYGLRLEFVSRWFLAVFGLVVFLFLQRYYIRGIMAGSVKG